MRFMTMIKANADYEAGKPPNPELMAAVARHSEESMKKGIVVEVGGLLPSATGARIQAVNGKLTVVDGPFAEVKELIGGYAIIEAPSKAEAVEHARRFMQVHIDVLGAEYAGECEVRQMYGPEGCGG